MSNPASNNPSETAKTGRVFAYYCSSHGFGHATRVAALTSALLSPPHNHRVLITTNAPSYPFSSVLPDNSSHSHRSPSEPKTSAPKPHATLRRHPIDPTVHQPKAYTLDRVKTVDSLRRFLGVSSGSNDSQPDSDSKDTTWEKRVKEEVDWLRQEGVECVLTDSVFLGCAAASAAGLPSVLITNFTFDSVYSYLSAPRDSSFTPSSEDDQKNPNDDNDDDDTDVPISASELAPLVSLVVKHYSHADLLLRLPGPIPIPAFDNPEKVGLAYHHHHHHHQQNDGGGRHSATEWLDLNWGEKGEGKFTDEIERLLDDVDNHQKTISQVSRPPQLQLQPGPPLNDLNNSQPPKPKPKLDQIPRRIIPAPLIVRPPSGPHVRSPTFRSEVLAAMGVPSELHTSNVLLVSFGGQNIPRPRPTPSPSRKSTGLLPTTSPSASPTASRSGTMLSSSSTPGGGDPSRSNSLVPPPTVYGSTTNTDLSGTLAALSFTASPISSTQASPRDGNSPLPSYYSPALPAPHPLSGSPSSSPFFLPEGDFVHEEEEDSNNNDDEPDPDPDNALLPPGWIAIVCGLRAALASSDGKNMSQLRDELPDGFYASERDFFIPDLMEGVADVVLGKLGYGTCSETVASRTPFIYVPRPLFIEEFGLRRLMHSRGVSVPMSRKDFEAGKWAAYVCDAWEKGGKGKWKEDGKKEPLAEPPAESIVKELESFLGEWDCT